MRPRQRSGIFVIMLEKNVFDEGRRLLKIIFYKKINVTKSHLTKQFNNLINLQLHKPFIIHKITPIVIV